ncbi:MAG: hypothetical protein GY861_20505 [bacterium]|nr:hypothetical protein [bacterium]
MLLAISIMLLAGCEDIARITVDNQLSTNVTIVHEGIMKDGTYSDPNILGTVSAGQTVELKKSLHVRRDIIGYTVILKAEDPSGKTVWQTSWPYEEFKKFDNDGCKITIKPNSYGD